MTLAMPVVRGRRRGLAIPLAAGFSIVMVILIVATTMTRQNSKRQTRSDFQSMKAQYLAHAAIQGALYKFRVLPNEAFDASGNAGALGAFVADVGTGSIALNGAPAGTWTSEITAGEALNSLTDDASNFNQDNNAWVHVVTLTAEARVDDGYLDANGNPETRTEVLTKTVEIKKQR